MKIKQPARAKTPRCRSLNRNPNTNTNMNTNGGSRNKTPVKKTIINADMSGLSGNNLYSF